MPGKKKSAKKVASKIHTLCSQRSEIQRDLEKHQKAMAKKLKRLAEAEKKAADLVKKAEADHKAKREREEKRFAKELASLGGPCKPRKARKKSAKKATAKATPKPRKPSAKKTAKKSAKRGSKMTQAQINERMAKMRAAKARKTAK